MRRLQVRQLTPSHRLLNKALTLSSFGLILWYLLTREEPFKEFTDLLLIRPKAEVFARFKTAICGGVRPEIPEDCQPSFAGLMTQCWDQEPANRPTFEQISRTLELILVDYCIADPQGRHLWRENFLSKDEVGLDAFQEVLFARTLPPLEQITDDMIRGATYSQLSRISASSLRGSRRVEPELDGRFPEGPARDQAIERDRQFDMCMRALLSKCAPFSASTCFSHLRKALRTALSASRSSGRCFCGLDRSWTAMAA